MEDDPCSQSLTRYRLRQYGYPSWRATDVCLASKARRRGRRRVMSTIANEELRDEFALHWNWREEERDPCVVVSARIGGAPCF